MVTYGELALAVNRFASFLQYTLNIQKGDRIAQITMNLVLKIPGLATGGIRAGGFGSTGV